MKRPDTYIGSVEPIKQAMWVFDKDQKIMVNRCASTPANAFARCHRLTHARHSDITFVPGLYKIVDEILVNAADNKVRWTL